MPGGERLGAHLGCRQVKSIPGHSLYYSHLDFVHMRVGAASARISNRVMPQTVSTNLSLIVTTITRNLMRYLLLLNQDNHRAQSLAQQRSSEREHEPPLLQHQHASVLVL